MTLFEALGLAAALAGALALVRADWETAAGGATLSELDSGKESSRPPVWTE